VDSRLPKLIFVLLVLYAVVHFSNNYSQLPAVVASHFNARGMPNGWQTKQAFFVVFAVVSFLIVFVAFGIPRLISALPPQLINLPNKQYWLAPQNLAETRAFLETQFAWFGCAVYVVIILAFDFAIQSNLHPENPPNPNRIWYILGAFLVFVPLWIIRLTLRFSTTPE